MPMPSPGPGLGRPQTSRELVGEIARSRVEPSSVDIEADQGTDLIVAMGPSADELSGLLSGAGATDEAASATDMQVPWSTIQDDWIRTGALRRLCARGGQRNPHHVDELYAEVSYRVYTTWTKRPERTVTVRTSLEAYLATIVKHARFSLARKEIRDRDARLRTNQPLRPRGLADPEGTAARSPQARPPGTLVSLDDPRWPSEPVSQDPYGEPENVLDTIVQQQTVRALRLQLTHRLATGDYACPYHVATRSGEGCSRDPGILFGAALGLVNRVAELHTWHELYAIVCESADPGRFGPAPRGANEHARRVHDQNRAKQRDRLEACVLHLVDLAIRDAGQAHSPLVAVVRAPMTYAVLQKLTQQAKPEMSASEKVIAALTGWLEQLLEWWRELCRVPASICARKGLPWIGEELCPRLHNSARVVERAAAAARAAGSAPGSVEARRLARAEAVVEDLTYWRSLLSVSPMAAT